MLNNIPQCFKDKASKKAVYIFSKIWHCFTLKRKNYSYLVLKRFFSDLGDSMWLITLT